MLVESLNRCEAALQATKHVGDQLTLAYDRKQLILERSTISEELAGQYVYLYDFPDGRLEVRWKGHVLPYRISDKAPPLFRGRRLVKILVRKETALFDFRGENDEASLVAPVVFVGSDSCSRKSGFYRPGAVPCK